MILDCCILTRPRCEMVLLLMRFSYRYYQQAGRPISQARVVFRRTSCLHIKAICVERSPSFLILSGCILTSLELNACWKGQIWPRFSARARGACCALKECCYRISRFHRPISRTLKKVLQKQHQCPRGFKALFGNCRYCFESDSKAPLVVQAFRAAVILA